MMIVLLLILSAFLTGCSEPDRRVTASTSDGEFTLALEAEKNRVRPGEELPVLVRVRHLGGPVKEEVVDEMEFAVNGGSVYPSSLTVVLAGPDSLGQGADQEFASWIVFTASSKVEETDQGEIHALFRDAIATLKIRIVIPPEDL